MSWQTETALGPETPHRVVPAVERAISILDLLSRDPGHYGISEISRALGLHKGTVRDILLTLQRHGLLVRDGAGGRYQLGYTLVAYAMRVLEHCDVRAVAQPFLKELSAVTGESVFLGIPQQGSILIVEKEESDQDLRMSSPIGRRMSIFAGSIAKVLLAFLPAAELEETLRRKRLPAFTVHSITSAQVYRRQLEVVARRGYALDDEEYIDGVRAASAPIRDRRGEVVAAISVVGFKSRISDQRLLEMGRRCRETADRISARLGAMAHPNGGAVARSSSGAVRSGRVSSGKRRAVK